MTSITLIWLIVPFKQACCWSGPSNNLDCKKGPIKQPWLLKGAPETPLAVRRRLSTNLTLKGTHSFSSDNWSASWLFVNSSNGLPKSEFHLYIPEIVIITCLTQLKPAYKTSYVDWNKFWFSKFISRLIFIQCQAWINTKWNRMTEKHRELSLIPVTLRSQRFWTEQVIQELKNEYSKVTTSYYVDNQPLCLPNLYC